MIKISISKGSGFVQPLKLSPHEEPSKTMLFFTQTLTKAPQIDWQTLKNFDYPILTKKEVFFSKATNYFTLPYKIRPLNTPYISKNLIYIIEFQT